MRTIATPVKLQIPYDFKAELAKQKPTESKEAFAIRASKFNAAKAEVLGKEAARIEALKDYGDQPLTAEEITARQAEEDKWETERPMKEWQAQMDATDNGMPRWTEDIIDVLTSAQQAALATETLEKWDNKKLIRGQKPE